MRVRTSNKSGLTLLEGLIVIVIIGLLAVIAISRFAPTKDKTFDAHMKTDVSNAMTAQEAYFDMHNTYANDVAALDFTASPNATTTVQWGDSFSYIVCAQHEGSAYGWNVNSGNGIITRDTSGC